MLKKYTDRINLRFQNPLAGEYTYRGYLEDFLKELVPDIEPINEPGKQGPGPNKPDFIIQRNDTHIAHIECKDIGIDMDKVEAGEQVNRYRDSFDHLILTDYLEFRFIISGKVTKVIRVVENKDGILVPVQKNFNEFLSYMEYFMSYVGDPITNPKDLAQKMATKAIVLKDIIDGVICDNEDHELTDLYEKFKKELMPSMSKDDFADMTAQTFVYGLFAARLYDDGKRPFDRVNAAEMIPKNSDFLRNMFNVIGGINIEPELKSVVDNLAKIFANTNLKELLKNFGHKTELKDPIIHFYETFLEAYNPSMRKEKGVWYTPEPAVNFVVRGTDHFLKTEFGIENGLSCSNMKDGQHEVQILDTSVGTGTFLAGIINFVHKDVGEIFWGEYVEKHLIPRLHGFELLMTSYAMCHIKLAELLKETGYEMSRNERFHIYLTNSLDQREQKSLFENTWFEKEIKRSDQIKLKLPTMVVMGNPPYNINSKNNEKWITDLCAGYKKEPGTDHNVKFNLKPINDDYVKFIRLGQYYIHNNGKGILAYVTPHGFIDNVTFRGMRWNLLKDFDKIYTVDLHGNSNKKEKCPDGSKDENIFDIQQGIAITFFIKDGSSGDELADVYHRDVYGTREDKFEYLSDMKFEDMAWEKVEYSSPHYFFKPKDDTDREEYESGFKLNEMFVECKSGMMTARDKFVSDIHKNKLEVNIEDLYDKKLPKDEFLSKYKLKEKGKFNINQIRKGSIDKLKYQMISYRPFDTRHIYYTPETVCGHRQSLMQHMLDGENVGMIFSASANDSKRRYDHTFISKNIINLKYANDFTSSNLAPLYTFIDGERYSNLNNQMVKRIHRVIPSATSQEIFDYIYAVLHDENYTTKFSSFLKIDFPRVPYPTDESRFKKLTALGSQLRKVHLLETPVTNREFATYTTPGTNKITKPILPRNIIKNATGTISVPINDEQSFDNIPEDAWNFYIGGYQPAIKWLKARKGMTLTMEDTKHFQKIINAHIETIKIMNQIRGLEK